MSPRGRRVQGEGSIFQKCEARYGCPVKVGDERPKHNCHGRWFGVMDLGVVGGRRVRRTVSAPTKRQLLPKFNALKAEMQAGVVTSDSTVAEWMTYYLDNVVARRKRKPSTMRNYRSKSDNWIVPNLGHLSFARLQALHIRALLARMEDDGKSPQSVLHVYTLLNSALIVAVNDRVLPYNPAASVDRPEVEASEPDRYGLKAAKAILRALDGREDRARWTVALLSGLRQGEALGLRWEDVDLESGLLTVEQAAQRITGQGIQMIPPKSETSKRTRPMVELTRFALEQMPGPHEGLVFGDGDKPLDAKEDSLKWHRMLKDVSAEDKPLKAARATTASLLQAAGIHPKTISEIMGHAQMGVTEKHYMAGEMDLFRDAMKALGELVAP